MEPLDKMRYPILRGVEKLPPPKKTIYRGAIINPQVPTQCDYYPDGGLAIGQDGTITAIGNFNLVQTGLADLGYEVVDQTERGEKPVIIPGMCDTHVHWVQNEVRGKFRGSLMPWLETHIWPEEHRYADVELADARAQTFFDELAKHGTTMAAIYSSIHEGALRAAFKHATGRMVIGNIIMTSDFPPYLKQDPAEALAMTDRFAEEFGSSYAVTPRFAPSCSAEVLKAAGDIARQKNVWIQTHLSENHEGTEHDEVDLVRRLFPDAASYTDVYARAGLLGRRAIMAHVIHASDEELAILAKTGTNVAHCPASNTALRSGRMPVERMIEHGSFYALGSDVGAGPSLSMLHVMQQYRRVHRGLMDIPPTEALYRGTLAGAKVLMADGVTGNLDRGKEATFAVIGSPGTRRYANPNDLLAEIFAGSQADLEKIVRKTYIAGRRVF